MRHCLPIYSTRLGTVSLLAARQAFKSAAFRCHRKAVKKGASER
jgi:hypothetical protein